MKSKTRVSVFETNSSSVHSLVVASEGLEPSYLPVDNDGYIPVKYGTFGKEGNFNNQIDKLSYLITQCYYLGGWEYRIDLTEDYYFMKVQEAIVNYVKDVKGIKIVGGEPDIDHQSMPEEGLNFVNVYDEKSIQDFVFNKFITLHCDCD